MMSRILLLASMLVVAATLTGGAAPGPIGTAPPSGTTVPAIPEPAALAVFAIGAGIVGVAIHRRRKP